MINLSYPSGKTIFWFLLAIVIGLGLLVFLPDALPQIADVNEAVTVQSGWTRIGVVMTRTCSDVEQVTANLICNNPGFEPIIKRSLETIGAESFGQTTFFSTNNQFNSYPANFMAGGTYSVYRAGAIAGTGTITGNTSQTGTGGALTPTTSGGVITAVSISGGSFAREGSPNGTFPAPVTGGSGSGASITYTVTGATLGGSGYTGGSITSTTIVSGGTGYTGTPTISLPTYFIISAYAGSGGFQAGDFPVIELIQSPSTQAQLVNKGLTLLGGAVQGETTDLPTGDLPAGSVNTQALQMTGATTISLPFDNLFSQGSQNHVNLSGSYTLTYSCKTAGTMSWSVGRGTSTGSNTYASGTDTCTGSWQVFTHTFTASENASTPGFAAFAHFASSGNMLMDNVDLEKVESCGNTGFRCDVVNALTAMSAGSIRILDDQLPTHYIDLIQTDIRSLSSYSFSDTGVTGTNLSSITLPMTFKLALQIGADAWYVLPSMLTIAEAQKLTDYIYGGCGTAGGADRCAQGQTTDYGTLFANTGHKIILELGNENWNSFQTGAKWAYTNGIANQAVTNFSMAYSPYGYWADSTCGAIKGQPSFNPTVTTLAIGGQTATSGVSFYMPALVTPTTGIVTHCDAIALAPYTQASATAFDTGNPSLQYQSALTQAYYNGQSASILGAYASAGYTGFQRIIYEFNNGLTGGSGGIPTQAELNGWASGEGYGLETVSDSLYRCQNLGYCASQNFFQLGQWDQSFNNGSGNVNNWIWGIINGMGSQNNNYGRGSYYALAAVNGCIPSGASMIQVTTSSWPTYNWTASNAVPAMSNVPWVDVFAFKSGTQRCIVVVNRDTASHTVTFTGSTLPTGTASLVYYHSANLTDDNETAGAQNIANISSTPAWNNTQTFAANSLSAFSYSTTAVTSTTKITGPIKMTGNILFH